MKKLIVTLALASSALVPATGSAANDPGSNVCHRLRNAIASGTRIATLPPTLVRDCFGTGGTTVRPTVATAVRIQPAPVPATRR